MKLIGHGIVAMASPGGAAQDAFRAEVKPLERAMLLNGLDHVLATRRGVAAGGRGKGGDAALIEAYRRNEDFTEQIHHSGGLACRFVR